MITLGLVLSPLGCASGPQDTSVDSAEVASVSISGLVYEFKSRDFLEGATVGLHELPGLTTTSAADGTWSFEGLEPGQTVTPWFELDGYRTASHRSFTLEADQERVYFQAVPTVVYELMFQALVNGGVDVDPEGCHLASTVTDPTMNEISTWEEFDAFMPHGLADATVWAEPGSESPTIYFNEDVFPDPSLLETTIDGGVLVANLPEGSHTLSGLHPTLVVEPVTIQCAPGRFVNASPPWGLRASPQ